MGPFRSGKSDQSCGLWGHGVLSISGNPGTADARHYQLIQSRHRMRHTALTADIRHLVTEKFVQLGLSCGAELCETILVRDGLYCGRRFDAENGHAIWFVEEEQIKFFRASGSVALVIDTVAAAPKAIRRAA
jgi:hypothetical protein